MATLSGNTLKIVSATIREFEKRADDKLNISNWIAQLLGNDRVKALVTIEGIIGGTKFSNKIENWQPARFIAKGAWQNVTGGKSEAGKILKLYESGLPAKVEPLEVLALFGYFVTLNILGKPISATSGGRAVLLAKMLEASKIKGLSIKIDNIGSGGQGDQFSVELNQDKIESLVNGGKWRGELVLALPSGGKRANSGGDIVDGVADEWV